MRRTHYARSVWANKGVTWIFRFRFNVSEASSSIKTRPFDLSALAGAKNMTPSVAFVYFELGLSGYERDCVTPIESHRIRVSYPFQFVGVGFVATVCIGRLWLGLEVELVVIGATPACE